jgi:hypothetical protein
MTKNRTIRPSRCVTLASIAAGLLAACDRDPRPPADAGAPAPDAGPGADVAAPPDLAPGGGASRPGEYPAGPYGIALGDTVGPVTFRRADDTPLSLDDIRKMASVKVIVVLETNATGQQAELVQMLNPVHDELAPMGVFMLVVVADPAGTAQSLMAFQAMTQWKGALVHGGRIARPSGGTSGLPTVYSVHAANMKVHGRLVGFAMVTADATRAAAQAALAAAPP